MGVAHQKSCGPTRSPDLFCVSFVPFAVQVSKPRLSAKSAATGFDSRPFALNNWPDCPLEVIALKGWVEGVGKTQIGSDDRRDRKSKRLAANLRKLKP